MTLPKDILPQVTAGELDAFSTIGGEERLVAFVNRFRELERERIIKLLDEHTYYGQNDWLEFSDKVTTMADLEALIKGEQK